MPMMVAFISMKGPYDQIPAAFGKLYGWISEKGYRPDGPAMAVYYTIPGQTPEDKSLWELRSQLLGDVAATGPDEQGLGVKRVEGVQVVATLYKGPYEQVEETYKALTDWVIENGYEIIGPYEELYLNDPSQTSPEEALTEIRFPIHKK
jgi:AraC family transcriptional regulator